MASKATHRARLLAASICAGLALVGCAPGSGTTPTAPDPSKSDVDKNLTYLYFTDGPDEQATRDLIAKFEEETGAKVTLEIVPFANLEQTLQARLSGNNAPDVARIDKLTNFREDLLDLNAYVKDDLEGVFLEGTETATVNAAGERLAVASDLTMNGPFVNVDMFEKAGVPVPTVDSPWKSWEEMVAAAKKVQEANGTEYAVAIDVSGHRFSTMISQYGTTAIGVDGKQNWDKAKLTKALTDLKKWNDDGTMPRDLVLQAGSKYKAANEIFAAEQLPVYLSGNWQVANFDKNATFKWATVPNACEDRCGGFPGGKFMISFKQAKNPQLAAEFIAWMNSADSQKYMSEKANFLPTRKDLTADNVSFAQRSDDMKVFLSDVAETPEDAFATYYAAGWAPIAKAIGDNVAAVLADQATPDAAADAIIAATDQAIKDAG